MTMIVPHLKTLKNFMCAVIIGTFIFCTFYWYILPSKHHGFLMEGTQDYWRWECNLKVNKCQRRILKLGEPGQTLRTCVMTCGPTPIWPLPNGDLILSNKSVAFHFQNVKILPLKVANPKIQRSLEELSQIFLEDIKNQQTVNTTDVRTDVQLVRILISVHSNDSDLNLRINIDESYKLIIRRNENIIHINIFSGTYFGARHGLETLSQLIWYDEINGLMRVIEKAKIVDAPLFTYRGLMLDTANHFIPIGAIKRTIKAMSAVKMNVFHWRLTGSSSFPFYLKNNNHAIYGAFSSNEIYTKEDIKSISSYALIRGIRVSIEIDTHSQIDRGWTWGPRKGYGDLNVCSYNKNSKVLCKGLNRCHQLNPSNNHTYELLKVILSECNSVSENSDFVHLGGRNVDMLCWSNSSDVKQMESYEKNGILGVLTYHQNRLHTIVTDLNQGKTPNIILSSDYFKLFNDPTNVISSKIYIALVNAFRDDEEEKKLIDKGYRVILSHEDKWFLNHLPHWTTAYDHRPWDHFLWSEKEQILGGEASLWTDFVDERTLDIRLWPATAAVAEVLWSEPQIVSLADASLRLQNFRDHLTKRGIKSNPITPKWCLQHPGSCL